MNDSDLIALMALMNAGLRFTKRPTFQLIIPTNAGPNDRRIEIGSVLPADLVAFYTGGSYTPIAGMVLYNPPDEYDYIIYCITAGGLTAICVGTRNTFGVAESFEVTPTLGSANATITFGQFATSFGFIQGGSSFVVTGAGSDITASAGGSIGCVGTGSVDIFGDFFIDGIDGYRGIKARADAVANSAAIGAEAVVLTTPAMDFLDGRAYRITWRGRLVSSAALTGTVRIRRTNAAGQLLDVWQWIYGAAQSLGFMNQIIVRRTAGSTLNSTIAITLQASAGTITQSAAATDVRYLQVEDVGPAASYPNAIAIV